MAGDIAQTDTYVVSRHKQKNLEMLFAHLGRIPKPDRLRLCGQNGARDEFHSPQQPRTSESSPGSCRTGRRSGPSDTANLYQPNPRP